MRVFSISLNTATLVVAVFLLSCNRKNETNESKDAVIASKPAIRGSRIACELNVPNEAVINEDASGCDAAEPFSRLSLFLQ
jgi:hypothetical protein